LLRRATFELRTLPEAAALASSLSACCPQPERRECGLLELLANAVEHGNLEFTGDDKQRLLKAGRWFAELEARLADPRYLPRRVRVHFERDADGLVTLAIEDEGPGFDWREVLAREPAGGGAVHGRGIALARALSFEDLVWEGRGNRVVARMRP
jgi:anti-sigma regulatory factor (Ser/Thr protein kinase)